MRRSALPTDCLLSRRRAGFILITVLAMLTFAILAATAVARQSLRMALESQRVESQLQSKWLRHTLRHSLLPQAGAILGPPKYVGEHVTEPKSRLSLQLSLNDETFTLIVADEQAKLNVNRYRELANRTRVESVVRRAYAGTSIRLRQTAFSDKHDMQSWGEVFDLSLRHTTPAELAAATSTITCWGSGAINVESSGDDALREMVSAGLGAGVADRLLQLRQAANDDDRPMLNRLAVGRRQQQRLTRVVQAGSDCHSLWLLPHNSPQRGELHIVDRSTRRAGEFYSFVW